MSHKAEQASDDENDSGSIFINEDATQQRHYDIGESIECVE